MQRNRKYTVFENELELVYVLIVWLTRYKEAHHLKGIEQFAKLVGMFLLIIHSSKHYVLDKYFLLTIEVKQNKISSDH